MSADILNAISVVAFVMAALFILLAVVLFFKLDVRAVINDLNGKTAEKQIKVFREQNRKLETNKNGRILYELSVEKTKAENIRDKKSITDQEKTTLLEQNEKTILLAEEETVLLQDEQTCLLEDRDARGQHDYKLVLDEIVVHTREKI